MALNGWHIGERLIHKKLGHENDYQIMNSWHSIQGELPDQHATFHTTRLPFMAVTILDENGRPWGSIIAGNDGEPGFIRRGSRYDLLTANVKPLLGDPLSRSVSSYNPEHPMLIAGIGIEFPTRRRNKLAGLISKLDKTEEGYKFDIQIREAIGNCPKYINVRDIIPHPNTSPTISLENLSLSAGDQLPEELIAFILNSDTTFLGTTYHAADSESARFPSHLGMNQRGGRKGFIRVLPSDKRTVILPDFSGNRFMTSLGNIEATPRASLTFMSFETGDILYLTGDAKNLINEEAQKLMPFQNVLTAIYVTGYTLVRDALPVRQRPGTEAQPSPYSPPIRYLAEEAASSKLFNDTTRPSAKLAQIELHSPTIATFTWEVSEDIDVVPGQAAIFDFTPLIGKVPYQHMNPLAPTSINDDRMRTWTISRTKGRRKFSLTMRQKPGGVVTGALFSIAQKISQARPELLVDSTPLNLTVSLVGITGDFVIPKHVDAVRKPAEDEAEKLLWVAGGIGVTPFLAMLERLPSDRPFDINFVLSTREPAVLLPLIEKVLQSAKPKPIALTLDVVSNEPIPVTSTEGITLRKHSGRISQSVFNDLRGDDHDFGRRKIFLCGPIPFEESVIEMLAGLDVDTKSVIRENFAY